MAKCRSMFAFLLVFAWTAVPALACFPNPTMTQAEMACCKKMAGECHMGVGAHPCCRTNVDRAAPVATIDRATTQIHPHFVAALLALTLMPEPTLNAERVTEFRGLPPPMPPGLNLVLRI
jgi:hypothetical protein